MRIAPFLLLLSALALRAGTAPFDQGWRFHLGEVAAAQAPGFNDGAWRSLDLPHDWSIEQPFDKDCKGHEDTGYLPGGTGWYRKTFSLPPGEPGRRVAVRFDGVYMDSEVWLNGHPVGGRPYGYSTFQCDLTPYLGAGANVLAVKVKVEQPSSRFYSGAGIYRHVWLVTSGPAHLAPWGVWVATPKAGPGGAQVRVRSTVLNEGGEARRLTLRTTLLDPAGGKVAEASSDLPAAAGGSCGFDQTLAVDHPGLWSPARPTLYTAVTELLAGAQVLDTARTPFGIRSFEFTRDDGFHLNGSRLQIQGVCDHHDLGCLGAAINTRALQRQMELLKGMGCNAIRTSHNPPAPELLDLCDRMGFLVMDEAFDEWQIPKRKKGYARFFEAWSEPDLVAMLHRDRNHPSIVLWSIGNEIEEQNKPQGGAMARRLAAICRREDPDRPVTAAVSEPDGAVPSGYAPALDVFGINYNIEAYQAHKGRILVGSETASALSTRGEYGLSLKDGKLVRTVRPDHQCTSYDLDRPEWGHTAETSLLAVRDAPWVAGEFVWTGFDYIGEPTPYNWPSRSSYFGILDLCGFPKDRFYLYQSQWRGAPMAHLLPHWSWPGFEGRAIPVWCFSNADSAELFLNGVSQGVRQRRDAVGLHFEWSVAYAPGTLKVVARKAGEVVAEDTVRTAGRPAVLRLVPDRSRLDASGADLSYVTVRVEDKDGNLCPDAAVPIHFALSGPGSLAGTDNGDPTDLTSFQSTRRAAFHGLALAVVKTTAQAGSIRLTATAAGLEPASAVLTTQPEVHP